MTEAHSHCSPPGPRFAGGQGRHFAPAQPAPGQNRLLAALSGRDYQRLVPDLEPCPLPAGWTFHDAGDRDSYLYFVTAGIVSRFNVMANGASAEIALTGNEGVIGVAAFLGGGGTTSRAVVLTAGDCHRLPADRLQHEFEHDGPLPRLLLRYTHALIGQIGLVSACVRHHTLEQRLCRWLLTCLDRSSTRELALTHQLIADMLGVRREGVTDAVGTLHEAGLIHSGRGRMVVLDRPRLEARVCECYPLIRREYDRLLADYRQAEAPARTHPATRMSGFRQPGDACVHA